MVDFVLPPSPNWFSPSVSSGSESGLYAFGSKSEVIVYDISSIQSQSSQGQTPKFVAVYSEHSNKVIGVCLSPDPTQWTCCSCQEDLIQLWDVRSLVTIQEIGLETKAKLTCLSWSSADTNTVYSSTDKGSVLIWQLKNNTLSSFDLSREHIVCIAASPHSSNVAAVGYRTGHAAIVSFENGRATTLHRLRSQEAEIFSISWCPVRGEDFTKWAHCSEEEGALLAVAGRQSLRVWSSLRGKEVFYMKLSPASVARRDANDSFAKKNWVDVVWSKQNPAHIIFTSSHGDLFYTNIQNEKKQEVEKFSAHGINKHTRMIFNVVEAGGKLCSFSLDRTIAVWDSKSKSGLISWTSFAGSVFCARTSPLDPGRIAIGAGDNNIRIWNQNNKSNPGDIQHIYQGIRSKVTYVAWHPVKEGLLAYGMEDGTVGVYNTLSPKAPEVSSTFHSKTVYVVGWAPAVKAEKGASELQVYSVGDGTVLQHFVGHAKREAVNLIEAIDGTKDKSQKNIVISEMSWRHDYAVFALGRMDGCVAVYAFPSLELLYLMEIQTKLINCVRWHPLTTAQSPAVSPCSSLVAFAGNDYCISIINLKDSLLVSKSAINRDTAAKEPVRITEGQGLLNVGKSTRVTDLCWSPHKDGLLASADYNGLAIVWDAKTMTQLASYKHESGRLLTILWSHLDFDTIMTGGTDSTFRKWRVSAQPKEVGKNKKKKKGAPKPKAIECATTLEDSASTSEIQELEELLKFKEKQLRAQIKTADEPLDSHTDASRATSTTKDFGPDSERRSNSASRATTVPAPTAGKSARQRVTDADGYPSAQTRIGRDEHRFGGAVAGHHRYDGYDDNADEDEDIGYAQDEVIPAVEDLVPPAKRLFPDRPVSRAVSSTANNAGSDGRSKFSKLKIKPRGLFPVSAAANNRSRSQLHEDILDLTRVIAGQDPTDIIDEKPHLGIYTDKLGAHRCLLQESARHLSDARMDYHLHLEMWRGNVAGAVQLAIQRNELSDWIVAMAPMASRDTWETVCRAYAAQLEEDHQYYKAASYLLAVSRVNEAIELFRRHCLYREAISLAKVRLSPIDPALENLYIEWGQLLLKDGNYEQSAKCFLAVRQIHEAIQMVARRQDTPAMKTACHMGLIARENEQALVYAHKALSQFLLAAQWKEACVFLEEQEGLKVFLPVVIAHELLVEQLSLLCSDLTLTQKPASLDSLGRVSSTQDQTSRHSLPEFILDKSDVDPVVPWEPLVLCGDGVARSDDGAGEGHGPLHTFPHHLMRVWHKRLNISMMTTDLKAARIAINHLTKLRSSMMDLPNVLVTVSIDVTSCLLALLAADTSSAINHLLKAMVAIQNSSNISDQHKLLMPSLFRLMLSQGPKYLLKLQQEFKALRVLLAMEQDGNLDRAGSEGNSIKRFLTDTKGEENISTSSNWCRELDCLRAYYYLAVLDYLQETQRMNEIIGSPNSATAAGGGAGSTQENDSLDGEPTSEGSSSGVPLPSGAKRQGTTSVSPGQEEHQVADVGASNPPCPDDLDQNGKSLHSQTPHGKGADKKDKKSSCAEASKQTAEFVRDKSCDDSIKKSDSSSATGKTGSKSPRTSESAASVSPLSAAKTQGIGSLSLESSVDPPPPVSPNTGAAQSKDNQSQSHPVPGALTLRPTTQPPPATATSLSPTGQQSPQKSPGVISPKSTASHTSMSPRNRTLSSSSQQASPSRHITSIASSPQTPGSRASTSSTHGHYCRGELTKDNLLRLSKGLLWDTQAKSEVLTETLGYIHKAISQHLLANREPCTSTSNTAAALPTAAGAASHSKEHSSQTAEPTSDSPAQSPSLAPQLDSSTTSPKPQPGPKEPSTKTSPLPATSSTSGQPQGDSLEEDGSVQQQRRMTSQQSPQLSTGVGAKELSPPQQASSAQKQQLSPLGTAPVSSKSLSPLSPTRVPKSPSASTSPVSPSTAFSPTATQRGATGRNVARSFSEPGTVPLDPNICKSGFDCAIGIQAERDLLGDLAGEPISFSNSKKVLWLDNSTKPTWQGEPTPLMLSPNGRNMRAAIEPWAKDRKHALHTPEGNPLPLEWDDLPVDEKFNQSYVTMALLKHQQEAIWQELKKGPDVTKVKFPPRSRSVRRLLECCLDSDQMTHEEKKGYIKQLSDWATLFSVTTYQKAETEALFRNIPEEFRDKC